jgi:transposase
MHPKPLVRRIHSLEFKERVLAACQKPGASIAAVALAHDLNSNLVHKWLTGIGMKRYVQHAAETVQTLPSVPTQFMPVNLPASAPASEDIRLDLNLGALHIKLDCARANAPSVAALLHAVADMVTRA